MPEVEWIADPTMPTPKIRRKRRVAPKMPEDPQERFAEVEGLLTDLVELVDHEIYDVYESVFFQRTAEYLDNLSFRYVEELDDADPKKAPGLRIRDIGREILAKKATSTKLFVRFFKSIVDFRS
jgi:hypothetical protein